MTPECGDRRATEYDDPVIVLDTPAPRREMRSVCGTRIQIVPVASTVEISVPTIWHKAPTAP